MDSVFGSPFNDLQRPICSYNQPAPDFRCALFTPDKERNGLLHRGEAQMPTSCLIRGAGAGSLKALLSRCCPSVTRPGPSSPSAGSRAARALFSSLLPVRRRSLPAFCALSFRVSGVTRLLRSRQPLRGLEAGPGGGRRSQRSARGLVRRFPTWCLFCKAGASQGTSGAAVSP